MVGLIVIALFSGVFMSLYAQSSWAQRSLPLSGDFYLAIAGLCVVAGLAGAGIWQARKGKPTLGLSRGGYFIAIVLPYVTGLFGGFLL